MRDNTVPFRTLALLVVLVALAAVAVFIVVPLVVPLATPLPPTALSAMARATMSGCLDRKLDLCKLDVGRYPTSLHDLEQRPASADDAAKWKGPYLRPDTGALHDPWGNRFFYKAPGTHNPDSYDLWSAGPDRHSGTSDDIRNWK
jgi:general secretion pathway protein G